MKTKLAGKVIFCALAMLPFFQARVDGGAAKPIFSIGRPDKSNAEFDVSKKTESPFQQRYKQPVEFTVGKSKTEDWPFIHPSTKDLWAGGKGYTFSIHFTVDELPITDCYLHIGMLDTHHAHKPSMMTVTCNDKKIESRRIPKAKPTWRSTWDGQPETMTFLIDKAAIRRGGNTLGLRLDDGKWAVYDYILLNDNAEGPTLQSPPKTQSLKEILQEQMGGYSEIIFVGRKFGKDPHWYANFGYFVEDTEKKLYNEMASLYKLNFMTGELTILLQDDKGSIRDPQVHYDGKKILFSYRKGGTDQFHLYEINSDGTGLRQLTDGIYDDIEPTYTADGHIIFCSSRCKRWVNCYYTKVAVLFRCDADGGNIEQISSNNEHDNTPWPMPDGRILYTRWEYVDRSQLDYHHLWTANPDGTGQMVYYGNLHPGIAMLDAKSIPNTNKIVAVFSPGHGSTDHNGYVNIVSPKEGPDALNQTVRIRRTGRSHDPYPLSENLFLIGKGPWVQVINAQGHTEGLYHLKDSDMRCHEPRPLMPRPRERVIPERIDPAKSTGTLVLSDIYQGRNMAGVKRGEIKKLLVLETLPIPAHYQGGWAPISYNGTFTLERVLGTIPVEADGSAYMELPADRSLFFVALDEQDNSVKRMQSFLTVRPGETTSCVGCHEHRVQTPVNPERSALLALKGPPSKVQKIRGIPEIFDFPRDIQPILDKHCLKCHDYDKRKGGVILTGDHGPMYSHSYFTLTYLRQFVDGRNKPKSNLPPRSIGTSASPIMKKISGGHNGVKLSKNEIDKIRYWIESGAVYSGTYAALGSGSIGDRHGNIRINSDRGWPEIKEVGQVIDRRCMSCHQEKNILSRRFSDGSYWSQDMDYARLRTVQHLTYNLSRPEKSLMLLVPLAKEAGGYGICKIKNAEDNTEKPVFASKDDPDYKKILAMCVAGKNNLEQIKRFDMPGFRPTIPYMREMKRYGVLPASFDPAKDPIDVYATDQAYFQMLDVHSK